MIFVDASALVSIAAQEADALELAGLLESDPARFSSPIALWEPSRPFAGATSFLSIQPEIA